MFLATSLSQEQLTAENEQARKTFALELGRLVGKLKSLGIASPPRPGPKPMAQNGGSDSNPKQVPTLPPRGSGQFSVEERDLSRDVRSNHNDNGVLVTEETYTDMQTGEQNGSNAKQEEFYTDMEPGNETGVIQDEFYTVVGGENESGEPIEQEEFYADVDPAGSSQGMKECIDSTDDEGYPPRSPGRPRSTASSSSLGTNSLDSHYAQFSGTKFKKFKASSLKTSAKAGFLEKLGGYRHNKWQKRYCVLDDICLFFFNSQKDKAQNNQLLLVDYAVSADVTEIKEKKNFLFKLSPTSVTEKSRLKTYFFRAPAQDTRDEWVAAMSAACQKGTGMGKRCSMLQQYHDNDVGTPSATAAVEPIPTDNDEFYDDTAPVFTITPSNTSEDSDSVGTPMTKRKPQPPPLLVEPAVTGPVPLSSRPDPPVDTQRVYYNDKWFNYSDVYVALWDCCGAEANEVSVRRGNLVLIVEKVNADWWLVTLQSEDDDFKGKSGLIPSAYLDFAFEAVH